MSRQYLLRVTAVFFCAVLAACGGGGGGGDGTPTQANAGNNAGSNGNGTSTPNGGAINPGGEAVDPNGGTSNPPSGNGGGSTPPSGSAGSFAARVTQAPSDGATINGTVRILVEGSGIRNVELLPATGHAPLTARGTVTGDNIGAYIDFDTTVIPDGQVTLRVAAFNAPPGEGGREITAMPARTWIIRNSAAPAFSAQLVSAPSTAPFLGDSPGSTTRTETVHFEVSGTGLGNVELVSAKDESIVYGRFTVSPDKTRATLDWNYLRFNDFSYGTYETRIVAWDVPPGGSGNKIEVMAPRTYHVHLPLGCQAEGRCGGTAP